MISNAELISLKDFSSHDQHPVVSLYLNVDGAKFPTRADYETEFSILASNLRKAARQEMSYSRDQEGMLDGEISALGQYLALDFKRNGTRGLVIFTCEPEGLWQVNALKVPVENHLYVDEKPQVAPLMEKLSDFEQVCVLLTNKENARIFTVFVDEITEHTEIMDRVLKRHGKGGWEQTKFQRRHEKQVREHLKKAATATLDFFKQDRFDRLAIGVADELWPELEKVLHPYLKERILGRFSLDVNSSQNAILARVDALAQENHDRQESTLLQSLGPELESGRTYVGGLDDVLAMLNERRVDLLLVESGYSVPGRKCPDCQTLQYHEQSCPTCDSQADSVADVVEEVREMAIRQSVRVITTPSDHPAMTQAGKIAARLRY